MSYYYSKNNEKIGPVSEEELVRLHNLGAINRQTLVWVNGWEDWKKLGDTEIDKQLPPPLPGQKTSEKNDNKNKAKNYIESSWRGEKSLAVAYWINGFLLSIALQVSIGFYNSAASTFPHIARSNVQLYYFVALLFEGFAIFATVWQTVGIWRSAENHKKITNKKVLAFFAQAVIVIMTIGAFVKIGTFGNYYKDVFWNALGKDTLGSYNVAISDDKTKLTINGLISFGIASDVDSLLTKNSSIDTVVLNSDGGRIWEGENLYDVLKAHKIVETRTESGCVSACTIPYLAGSIRTVKGNKPLLGFHSSSTPYLFDRSVIAENQRWQTFMMSLGISSDFAKKAVSTPPTGMWYPKFNELVNEKIVEKDFGVFTKHHEKFKNDGILPLFEKLYYNNVLDEFDYLYHIVGEKLNPIVFIKITDKKDDYVYAVSKILGLSDGEIIEVDQSLQIICKNDRYKTLSLYILNEYDIFNGRKGSSVPVDADKYSSLLDNQFGIELKKHICSQ